MVLKICIPVDMCSAMSEVKSNAIMARMRHKQGGEVGEKSLEISKVEIDWRSVFHVFTCEFTEDHSHDRGACRAGSGQGPEEPVLGHCTDQLRHVKHGAQESWKKMTRVGT